MYCDYNISEFVGELLLLLFGIFICSELLDF